MKSLVYRCLLLPYKPPAWSLYLSITAFSICSNQSPFLRARLVDSRASNHARKHLVKWRKSSINAIVKNMDWFPQFWIPGDTSLNPAKKPKTKSDAEQGNISAAFRAQDFKSYFYDSDGKMFCKSCNVVVEHTRKFAFEQHLDSRAQYSFGSCRTATLELFQFIATFSIFRNFPEIS